MASSEIKNLVLGGNSYALSDELSRGKIDNLESVVSGKQATLVSGTNIKTINGNSLLGSGNITISSGTNVTVDTALSTSSTNPVQNKVVTSALNNKQAKLVSGTNIKTINGTSLLGSGDITISGGGSSSGLTNYDFVVDSRDVTSSSTQMFTFHEGARCYYTVDASVDFNIAIDANNAADNYILVHNTGSADIDILVSAVAFQDNNLSSAAIHIPQGGITVPAGNYIEISVYVNASIAVITASSTIR